MHQPSPSPSGSPLSIEPLDVDFLANVLVERELPLDADTHHTDTHHTDTHHTDTHHTDSDLTVIDLTEPDGARNKADTRSQGWGLSDGTAIGRLVTPDHVLAARAGYRNNADGRRQPVRSIGIRHQTPAGFANEYVIGHLLGTVAATAGGGISPVDAGALAQAKLIKDAQRRLEHFLKLSDDDFSACFRFNGEITGEYLTQVERSERDREAIRNETAEPVPEPSPKPRRRTSRSLRRL